MESQDRKCVLVIDPELPPGVTANTAAILGITLGKELPEVVGETVTDGSGRSHLGIIRFPVPVLRAGAAAIRELREKLYRPEYRGLTAVDFSDLAQGCSSYREFIRKLGEVPEEELRYYGVAICGEKGKVNRLTGSLPLLRS